MSYALLAGFGPVCKDLWETGGKIYGEMQAFTTKHPQAALSTSIALGSLYLLNLLPTLVTFSLYCGICYSLTPSRDEVKKTYDLMLSWFKTTLPSSPPPKN